MESSLVSPTFTVTPSLSSLSLTVYHSHVVSDARIRSRDGCSSRDRSEPGVPTARGAEVSVVRAERQRSRGAALPLRTVAGPHDLNGREVARAGSGRGCS